ncbi:hypothetical protein ACT453_60355, partial [Bacillus sp. D-CC]
KASSFMVGYWRRYFNVTKSISSSENLLFLRKAYAYIHQSRGRKSKFSLEEMLFVTLKNLIEPVLFCLVK